MVRSHIDFEFILVNKTLMHEIEKLCLEDNGFDNSPMEFAMIESLLTLSLNKNSISSNHDQATN